MTTADWGSPIVIVPLIVAFVAASGVIAGVMQKHRNDSRTQWWTRMQWGLDALQGVNDDDERDEERRYIATVVIDRLEQDATGNKDRKLAKEVIEASLRQYDLGSADDADTLDDEGESEDDAT